MLLDFIDHLTRSGAAKSAFKDLARSLAFLELSGERDVERLLHLKPAFTNAVDEASAQAATRPARAGTGPRGQAPPMVVAVLAALESVVVGQAPAFIRFYAWTRLLRHWAALRWDDTLGIRPDAFERRARGLYGVLERTKTSGPGKRLLVLPFFVSDQAFLLEADWLFTGWTLLGEVFGFKRDYLLPLASSDLQGGMQRRAEYTDAVCYSRSLMAFFEVPGSPCEALLDSAAVPY